MYKYILKIHLNTQRSQTHQVPLPTSSLGGGICDVGANAITTFLCITDIMKVFSPAGKDAKESLSGNMTS